MLPFGTCFRTEQNPITISRGIALIEIGDVWAHSPHTLAGPTFHMSL